MLLIKISKLNEFQFHNLLKLIQNPYSSVVNYRVALLNKKTTAVHLNFEIFFVKDEWKTSLGEK